MDKGKTPDIQGRRNFLKGAVVLGVVGASNGANALSGVGSEPAAAAACEPAWLKAPEAIPDSQIGKTVTADVVVIGSALSGLSAARAALEAGATVAVIEKAPDMVYRSCDVGVINSSIAQKLGNRIDPAEIVTAIQDYYSWRTSADLWRHWAENSGAALDWWLSLVPDYKLIDENFNVPIGTKEVYVRMPHWPHPKAYDPAKEHYKCFSTVHQILPDMGVALRAVQTRCKELGGSFYYSTWARQLIRSNNEGRVLGVIAQQKDGSYIKFLARRGVVLCTGDYSGDRSMVEHYCPQAADLYPHTIYPNIDANGKLANTGDGQKMGVWIGAQMERGPHAPVNHCMGGPLGDDAFLLVNVRGERFMNEDNDAQHWTNAFERQPQAHAFQIFDAKWREQLACQGISHGQFYKVGTGGLGGGMSWSAVTTEQRVLGLAKTANTLEELAAKLELPVEAFTATVKRYNELAHQGNDTDYYKRADRLFPVETAPFYGGRAAPSLLVIMGGLVVSAKCEVCDGKFNTIPGLFAAGNAMGCRFSGDYAVTAAGVSHGTALTFGRLAGQMAAKG